MSIEADPQKALSMGSWWKRKEANQLEMFAWVDDHFKDEKVQRVVDFVGERHTDSCGDYYELVNAVREAAGGMYVDSSTIHHESVGALSRYIELKAKDERATMAAIKREKIEKLKKELAELESATGSKPSSDSGGPTVADVVEVQERLSTPSASKEEKAKEE